MNKIIITILFLFSAFLYSNAQQYTIDNIDSIANSQPNDSLKIKTYGVFIRHSNLSYPERISFLKKEIALNKNNKFVFSLYLDVARYYFLIKNDSLANKYVDTCYQIGLENGKDYGIADSYLMRGNFRLYKGDYWGALNWYYKAEKIYLLQNDTTQLISVYNNEAVSFVNLKKYDKAIDYFLKVEKLLEKDKRAELLTHLYINIGIAYTKINQNEKALEYYKKGISLKKILADTLGLSVAYNNMGDLMEKQGNYLEAINYFNKALNIKIHYKDSTGLVYSYTALANTYMKLGSYDKVIEYTQKAINISVKDTMFDNLIYNYDLLSQVYKILGDSAKTQHFRTLKNKYTHLYDKLKKDKYIINNDSISRKENEQNDTNNSAVKSNKQSNTVPIILSILIVAILIFIFIKHKKK